MKTNPSSTRYSRALVFAVAGWAIHSLIGGPTSYTYDPAGRLVSADYGAGKSASYAYDNAGNLLQSSQPAPGLLIGALAGNQVTLSWPAASAGFVLQTSPSLGSGAQWIDVSVTPAAEGNLSVVTINVGSETQFYRLRKN
ncbi:MAG: RHS repeat protein [Verrucomicrobia bacterium]|nr:RHS repeat protein [Verrucomicrobiota bacterium]